MNQGTLAIAILITDHIITSELNFTTSQCTTPILFFRLREKLQKATQRTTHHTTFLFLRLSSLLGDEDSEVFSSFLFFEGESNEGPGLDFVAGLEEKELSEVVTGTTNSVCPSNKTIGSSKTFCNGQSSLNFDPSSYKTFKTIGQPLEEGTILLIVPLYQALLSVFLLTTSNSWATLIPTTGFNLSDLSICSEVGDSIVPRITGGDSRGLLVAVVRILLEDREPLLEATEEEELSMQFSRTTQGLVGITNFGVAGKARLAFGFLDFGVDDADDDDDEEEALEVFAAEDIFDIVADFLLLAFAAESVTLLESSRPSLKAARSPKKLGLNGLTGTRMRFSGEGVEVKVDGLILACTRLRFTGEKVEVGSLLLDWS